MPAVADIRVRTSVGNIMITAPAGRAVRLRSDVGDVKLRLDGQDMKYNNAPGSGDRVELGDMRSPPRIDAHTSVGKVTAELRTR
jgi:hypothetical protein